MGNGSALQWLDSLQGSGIRPGLGRIRALLRSLGRPHNAYHSIITAGTNGKGSTSATLESILRESGYRTGFYTSPHLVDLRERWMIDGKPIDETLLDESIVLLRGAAERIGITPTYFEALTVVAFIAFERARCDVVVLEVGMGGRLDATNVVRPIAALITPIGFDHTEFLGNTIRKIASEKAGVIHRGAIVLTSNTDPVVLSVLRKRAERFGNPFHLVTGSEVGEIPLLGDFQRQNVALAARAAEELKGILPRITRESIRRGIARTRWRGRLERIDIGDKQVWVDGCHNAHAAVAIAPFVDKTLPKPRLLVFGIMADKDVAKVTSTLFPLFDSIITTEPFPPRSTNADILARTAMALGIPVKMVPDSKQAVRSALASGYRSVLVAGSLYLAGAAIEVLDAERDQQHS